MEGGDSIGPSPVSLPTWTAAELEEAHASPLFYPAPEAFLPAAGEGGARNDEADFAYLRCPCFGAVEDDDDEDEPGAAGAFLVVSLPVDPAVPAEYWLRCGGVQLHASRR